MPNFLDVGSRIWGPDASEETGGTLGCYICLPDSQGPARHFLTAAHVVGIETDAIVHGRINDEVREVGRVVRGVLRTKTRHDYSVVQLADDLEGRNVETHENPTQQIPEAIPSFVSLSTRTVVKWGSTTGRTSGRIVARPREIEIRYGNTDRVLHRPLRIISENGFARPGDSGAIVWSTTGEPLAMIVGGVPNLGVCYALPLSSKEMGLVSTGTTCD